jgi:hypothetical protein
MTDSFAELPIRPRSLLVGPWIRRAVMTVLALVVLAALVNRFGQHPARSITRAPAATMRVTAPDTVRGGLFFESRVEIRAAEAIAHPRLVLDDGWLEGMQVNSIEPAPVGEASRDGRVVLSYDALDPGDVLRVWMQFEVNPTNVGRRSYGLALDDAERPVARIARDITVLP